MSEHPHAATGRLGVVFAGGDPPGVGADDIAAPERLLQAVVVCADSGVSHARALGVVPAAVVGDLESADWADVEWVRGHWPGKLIVKGILDPDDARQAVRAGADAINAARAALR